MRLASALLALLNSDFAFAMFPITELSDWLASFFLWMLSSVRRNASKFSIQIFFQPYWSISSFLFPSGLLYVS